MNFSPSSTTHRRNILLDFRAVRLLSSAALGMLLRAYKNCDVP